MAGGRPTKYSKKILVQTIDYIENYQCYKHNAIPSIAGLALHLDLSRDTIYAWKDSVDEDGKLKHAEFSYIIEKLMSTQEQALMHGGLRGTFNPTISKLILSKHGYVDKQELTGNDGNPLEVRTWTTTIVDPESEGDEDAA